MLIYVNYNMIINWISFSIIAIINVAFLLETVKNILIEMSDQLD